MTEKRYLAADGTLYTGVIINQSDTEISEETYLAILSEKESAAQRRKRDLLISGVRWRIERHNDEVLMGVTPTEPIEPILEYIQALRDVPAQPGFPESINWPEEV